MTAKQAVDPSPARWRVQRGLCLFARFVLRVFFGLRAVNVPRIDGPFIVAPNHTSYLDPMVVQVTFPRHITFLMAGDVFKVRLLTWFYDFWRAIPIPAGSRVVADAMKRALGATRRGQVVGIFPEGRISLDGRLQDGQAGVATLMQRSRVPVVPVAILGTYRVLPKQARFPRPGRLLVVYGDPIDPESVADDDKKIAAAKLRDRVMAEIAAIQSRYPEYA